MNILDKYAVFVNDQIAFQEKMAAKYANTPWRQALHLTSLEKFKSLLIDLGNAQLQLTELAKRPEKELSPTQRLTLTMKDIEGLPPELIQELSISDTDRHEFAIEALINEGGALCR